MRVPRAGTSPGLKLSGVALGELCGVGIGHVVDEIDLTGA